VKKEKLAPGEFFSIGFLSFQSDLLRRMHEPIDKRVGDQLTSS